MTDNINSLAHSKWNCKYHIVFAPKYRRQVIYGKINKDEQVPTFELPLYGVKSWNLFYV